MDIGNPTQLHTCVTEPLGWLSQDGSAHRFLHIAQDNFYRNLTLEEQSNVGAFNFDHPTVSALTSCGSLSVHVSFTQAGIPIQHAFCGLSALVPVAGMLRDIFGTHMQALACAAIVATLHHHLCPQQGCTMKTAGVSLQAFAWAEIVATLQDLKDGQPACIPQYDFVTSSRTSEPTPVESADVILFDGILAFYSAGMILPLTVSE